MTAAAADSRPSLEALTRPAAYPDDPSARDGVEWIQTHISDVFLTGERVYKFRKPVHFGFVCFSERAERNADCMRELGLNRRLAPDVYLGVAPLLAGTPTRIGPVGEEIEDPGVEHCVVMRRLRDGRDALSLLDAGALSARQLDRLAQRLAVFHAQAGLGAPAPFAPRQWHEVCVGPFRDTLASLGERELPESETALLAALRGAMEERSLALAERFESRRRAGRAVDGHGDLHLDHVWFETDDAEPLCIDCLEFDAGLRRIDGAADAAFLAMDLRYRGHPELAERFLRRYAREAHDPDLTGVVDFFASYRAAVRAKVAALATEDTGIQAEQRERAHQSAARHLALAARLIEPAPIGALVLVGGVVGTGKTTLAEALAERLDAHGGAAVLSSDRIRKQGGESRGRGSPIDRGLYAPERRRAVYAELIAQARGVVLSGRTAILDATWSSRADREAVVALAGELGAACLFVEARCSKTRARDRLARRQASGTGLSDAGPEFYDVSRERFEEWRESEGMGFRVVDTDRSDWTRSIDVLAAELVEAAGAKRPGTGEERPAEPPERRGRGPVVAPNVQSREASQGGGGEVMNLRDRTVADVMHTEVATLSKGEHLDLAEDIMRVGRVRHMPVVEGKRLIGVVSSRDLLAASLSRAMEFEPAHRRAFLRSVSVDEAMTHEPHSVTRDTLLVDAAAQMLELQIACLPVVDDDGLLLGIVTETDLVRVAFLDEEPSGPVVDVGEARRRLLELPGRLRDEIEAVRTSRDELRVQLHLARADARELWHGLEQKWHELERRTTALAREAETPAHEAREVAEELVKELKRGYRRIKASVTH